MCEDENIMYTELCSCTRIQSRAISAILSEYGKLK